MRRRAFALLMLLILTLAAFGGTAYAVTPDDWDQSRPGALEEGHLYAQTAVLIDADTGDVLFDKDSLVRMYPASTTKIMTLLLALESDIPLDQEITIPQVAQNIPSDSSVVPVFAGEVMTFRDLLYGTMLKSGNDGANAIAYLVGEGSIDSFVAMMNERAAEIGCTSTHFSNAHGYHDDTHFSTAYDLARIAQTAMQNETFREIVSTATYTMAPTVNRGEYNIVTSSEMVNPASVYYYEGCVGIKTGFHSRAGQCFVGALERDGVSLIAVVLNTARTSSETTQKWADTEKLFDYGLAQYEPYQLEDLFDASGREFNTVSISNAATDDAQRGLLELRLTQLSDGEYTRRVRSGGSALAEALADFRARSTITYNEGLCAPIAEGEIVGTLTYTSPEGEVITAMLAAERAMEARPEYATIYDVLPFLRPMEPFLSGGGGWYLLICLIVLVALIFIVRARRKFVRNRRRQSIYNAKRREYNRMEAMRRQEEARRRREAERRRREAERRRREEAERRREAARRRAAAARTKPKPGAHAPNGARPAPAARPNGAKARPAQRKAKDKDLFDL